MFILNGIEQLEKAIARAKKIRPRVEFDRFGRYRVSGSKGYYTVICRKDERGYKNRCLHLQRRGKRLGLLSRRISD
jgi:hypothetical protein